MATLLERFSNDSAALHARLLAGLVQVRRGGRSIGAGTAWHAGGLILTNAHVVAERGRVSDDLSVSLADGREFPVRLLAADPALDLAALRTVGVKTGAEPGTGLPTVELGDSRALRPGELVFALGFPFGVTGGATAGTVIGLGRDLPELSAGGREWLAASLHLRPGHSGGPMADAQGRLVGINTLMHGPDVGIAVPVHVAKEFLQRAFARSAPEAQSSGKTVIV